MARWVSAAATDESTPPLNAQMTRSLTDLLPDLLDRRLDIGLHGPGRFAPADVIHEVSKQLRAVRRVRDFGMELQAIDPALAIVPLHRRNR